MWWTSCKTHTFSHTHTQHALWWHNKPCVDSGLPGCLWSYWPLTYLWTSNLMQDLKSQWVQSSVVFVYVVMPSFQLVLDYIMSCLVVMTRTTARSVPLPPHPFPASSFPSYPRLPLLFVRQKKWVEGFSCKDVWMCMIGQILLMLIYLLTFAWATRQPCWHVDTRLLKGGNLNAKWWVDFWDVKSRRWRTLCDLWIGDWWLFIELCMIVLLVLCARKIFASFLKHRAFL